MFLGNLYNRYLILVEKTKCHCVDLTERNPKIPNVT